MSLSDLPQSARDDYLAMRELPDGRVIGVARLMFHWTLHIDIDEIGYADKYCYRWLNDTLMALAYWDGTGDPPGQWHQHLNSGRWRDPETGEEWIQW